MYIYRKLLVLVITLAMIGSTVHKAEAVTYVTDTGGGAYDESRACPNLAPAIALATVAIVAIIAIAVQNSHGHSSSSSSHHGHHGSSSRRSCSSCSSYSYSSCSYCSDSHSRSSSR